MDFEGRLKQTNGRLRAARVGVSIEAIGNRLYLRATLPVRPGVANCEPYQQRLSLHYHANVAGLQLAEKEARKVGALLDCGQFDWAEYVTSSVKFETVADWIERYEKDYFTRRNRTPKSETTWRDDYLKVFGELPADAPLTELLLRNLIEAKAPDTRTRKRFVDICTRLANFAGLDVNFGGLRGNYSSSSVVRSVPSDQVIAETRESIPNPSWRWAYGMMACYGLRNHELFYLDCDRLPLVIVRDGSKTGFHRVHPFYPEWFDSWNLADVKVPNCTGKDNSALGNRVTHAMKRYKIPFAPYDLRHAWAVRTIAFKVPTTLAARMMGHSVDVHEKIYHQWITEDFELQVIQKLMDGDRPIAPGSLSRLC